VVALGVTAWAVIESRDPSARSLDIVGTVLISASLFSLTWGLIKTANHAWLGTYTLAFIGAAIVLGALFVLWESRIDDPMIPLSFFRIRAFTVSSIVVALVGVALFGVIYFLTLYFQNVRGYDPIQAGLRTLPTTMMILFVAPIGGRLSGRVGPRWLMTVGMLMASVGLFGLSFVKVDSSYNLIWPFQMLMGAGMALTMPAVSATGMAAVERTKAGIASGVINASRQVGGALGIAVLGGIGTTLAADAWASRIAGLPPGLHAAAERLTPLVQGGQGKAILAITHSQTAQANALESFVHGVNWALRAGAGLTLAAALVAGIGLAHMKVRAVDEAPAGEGEGEGAETPPAVVEM
jgi:MFS family permease